MKIQDSVPGQSPLIKVSLIVAVVTGLFFATSYVLATLADGGAYDQVVMAQLKSSIISQRGEQLPKEHKVTSPLGDYEKIEISSGSIDLEVSTHSSQEISVSLIGHFDDAIPFTVKGEGPTLKVKVEFQGSGEDLSQWIIASLGRPKSSSAPILRVAVPADIGASLELFAGSGQVRVLGLVLDQLQIQAGSGDVEVSQLQSGSLDILTGSGDVKVSGAALHVQVKAGSGDISLADIQGENINLTSGSGDISLGELVVKSARVLTGSGDISARLGKLEEFTVSAKTFSGEIVAGTPTGQVIRDAGMVNLGKGAKRIELSSGSGDIDIRP